MDRQLSNVIGFLHRGSKTETAGTIIRMAIPPNKNGRTVIMDLLIATLGTAHTLTVLRPLGKTTLSAAAAAGQAVVNLTADPGAFTNSRISANGIAANDLCLLELADGTYQLMIVSSVSSLAVTMGANLDYAALKGATLWFFGVPADTNPRDPEGLAHATLPLAASSSNRFNSDFGVLSSFDVNEPLLLSINNATNASTIHYCSALYMKP